MMGPDRKNLYKLPWSKSDNAGGWVEVTDKCNLFCPGCYRHRLEGHRSLEDIKDEILVIKKKLNCDRIAVAGGEPLMYPQLLDVVRFISENNMKPLLLTNGQDLTTEWIQSLKKAGLIKFHFHVDSGMERPGWKGKTEKEINELRQHYANMVFEVGGIQSGYNITISRKNIGQLPDIVEWARSNINKVNHLSLVTLRGIPLHEGLEFYVADKKVDASVFQNSSDDSNQINITTTEMLEVIQRRFPDFMPATFLSGTSAPETFKFLVGVQIGTTDKMYGYMGHKALEIIQTGYHMLYGRYFDFLKSNASGKKIFLLSPFDKGIRKALVTFLLYTLKHPAALFKKVYMQTISLQQPNEIINGQPNLCDGCMNMMLYQGKLIHSCQLDEYRMFGGMINPVKPTST